MLVLLAEVTVHAQNSDSLRQVIKAMSFDIPVLSPVPSSVYNTKTPVILLNGTWKFNPDNKEMSSAKNIEVPGEWVMQGFNGKKDKATTYWKSFMLPADWKGNRVKIRFDGVSSFALVKVNGIQVGTHEGSFVAFEFDITDAVKPSENILEIEVQCETISDILACTSQYAAHPVGGILRKVTLFVLPEINISDFTWSVKFDQQYRDASIHINSKVAFNGKTVNQAAMMLVPFNNDDGGAPHIAGNNYTQDIQPLEYKPIGNFKTESVKASKKTDGSVQINLSGMEKNKLEGTQDYIFNTDGTVTVSYDYITLADFRGKNLLRQFGLLFTLPESFDQLSWERKGLWTIYPEYDINRLKGFAKALPRNLKYVEAPREVPAGEWKDNANKLGTNDFKSTKDHILQASLKNDKNIEIIVQSDGSQSTCSWIDGKKTRFLVAGLNGPGSCGFFTGPRPEFKKGDHLTGKFILGIQ